MRRYHPILQLAVISGCDATASVLAERVNRRGQFAHVFASAEELCNFSQLQLLDLILIDRRPPGFAMTLSALRARVRAMSCYATFCGFGRTDSLVPVGVDYAFCSILTEAELASVLDDAFQALEGDLLHRRVDSGQVQLIC